jgi:hypothetical protein
MRQLSIPVMGLTGATLVAGALASCGPSNDSGASGGGVGGAASANGGTATSGGSFPSGGNAQAPSGGNTAAHSGSANAGGNPTGSACGSNDSVILCETSSLTMPPPVEQHAASGPWDQILGGKLSPGTYVLTDLAKHGDPTTCARLASAIFVFEPNGRASHGWEERDSSWRISGTYRDGPVDGTVVIDIDCPVTAEMPFLGIPFRTTDAGFTVTNSDGTVMTFTRR